MIGVLTLTHLLFAVLMIVIVAVLYGIVRLFGSWIKTDLGVEHLTGSVWAICTIAAIPVTGLFVELLGYGLKWLAGMPV